MTAPARSTRWPAAASPRSFAIVIKGPLLRFTAAAIDFYGRRFATSGEATRLEKWRQRGGPPGSLLEKWRRRGGPFPPPGIIEVADSRTICAAGDVGIVFSHNDGACLRAAENATLLRRAPPKLFSGTMS